MFSQISMADAAIFKGKFGERIVKLRRDFQRIAAVIEAQKWENLRTANKIPRL